MVFVVVVVRTQCNRSVFVHEVNKSKDATVQLRSAHTRVP